MGWVIIAIPGRFIPRKETHYPLYRRLGGPQGQAGRVRETSLPPGFDLRPIPTVASRSIDHAFPAPRVWTVAVLYIVIYLCRIIVYFQTCLHL
jgi:hypothetical protein